MAKTKQDLVKESRELLAEVSARGAWSMQETPWDDKHDAQVTTQGGKLVALVKSVEDGHLIARAPTLIRELAAALERS